jgi:hypothetical protein
VDTEGAPSKGFFIAGSGVTVANAELARLRCFPYEFLVLPFAPGSLPRDF